MVSQEGLWQPGGFIPAEMQKKLARKATKKIMVPIQLNGFARVWSRLKH